jgi:predicted Zn-dependent peptidase
VLVAEPIAWMQSAAFTILLPAGAVDDPAEREGLAALSCDLVQRGAGPRDARQIVIDLDNLGLRRSDSVSSSHTAFSGATVWGNLPAALTIYADVLRRPTLPADQLEASRSCLLQQIRAMEDEPAQKVMVELRRRHYPHPWGSPPEGSEKSVQAIALADVRQFVQKHYMPNGTIIAAAGRVQWEALRELVGQLFADWPVADKQPLEERPAERTTLHIPYASNQTHIGIAWDAVPYNHPDYFRAWGAVGVLGSGTSSRLFMEVREKRGLCYSVYASYHTLRERGAVLCYAGTTADRAQQTLEVMLAESQRLAEGIQPDELDRLKARIKSALVMQQESSSARSNAIARDWYHLGRVRTLEELGQLIDQLSCESINQYLAEHPPKDFTVVVLGPRELRIP